MKKLSKVLLLVLAVTLVFASCTGGGATTPETPTTETPSTETPATETPAPTGDQVVVTVWTKDRHDLEFMTAKIAEFEAANPDIKVSYEPYTDNYQQTIEMAATNGQLPDIICSYQPVITSLKARGDLAPLNDYMTDEMKTLFTDDLFIEGVNMVDGKIVSLPNTGNSLRLVYNKELLAAAGYNEAPKSLADMVDAAKKITAAGASDGIYGFALPLKDPTTGFNRGVQNIPQLSGAPVREGYNFVTGKYDWGAYVPTIEALKTMWTDGSFFLGSESLEIDPLRTNFAEGKIGMYMTYSHSEYGVYKDQFPMDPEKWSYAELPTESGTVTGSQFLSAGFWYSMTNSSKNPDAAWRVMEYLYSPELLKEYYEGGFGVSTVPGIIAVSTPPEAVIQVPLMSPTENDKMWPLNPQGITVEPGVKWGDRFFSYIYGESNDINAIVEELNATYDAAMQVAIDSGAAEQLVYPNFKASDPAGTAN